MTSPLLPRCPFEVRGVLAAKGRSGSKHSGVFAVPVHPLQCAENTKFLVRASYLEIYNEDVRDLLGADSKQKLEVGAAAAWAGGGWWRGEAGIGPRSLRSTGKVS